MRACNWDAGDLSQRVHAGVGAARTLGQGRFADDAAESRLQFALNSAMAGLDLPAVKVGAVVGEGEFPRLICSGGLGGFCHRNQCR